MILIYTLPILCGSLVTFLTMGSKKSRLNMVLAMLIPALSLGLYGLVGSPQKPDHPFVQTQHSKDLWTLVARLEHHLATKPDDLDGWVLLGRSYRMLNIYDKAAQGFAHAGELDPSNALIPLSEAESLILQANGQVTTSARLALDKCLELDPKQTSARYYVGLYAMQKVRLRKAQTLWHELLLELKPGTPLHSLVKTQLNHLKTIDKKRP